MATEKFHTHLFLEFWLTPWSWMRPSFDHYGGDWRLCFGFGQLETITD